MKHKTYSGYITELENNQIFVYGANPEGRHGAGTAKIAMMNYGAKYGHTGLMGQSYGLITKNINAGFIDSKGKVYKKGGLRSISQIEMIENIKEFYELAESMPDKEFLVVYTASGRNLNGYSSKEMAKMFSTITIPSNIVFEDEFYSLMEFDKPTT